MRADDDEEGKVEDERNTSPLEVSSYFLKNKRQRSLWVDVVGDEED